MSVSGARFDGDKAIAGKLAFVPVKARGDIVATRELFDQILPSQEESYFALATEIHWFERDFAAAADVWDRPEIKEFESLAGYTGSRELYQAQAYQQLGDQARAAEMRQQGLDLFVDLDHDGPRQNTAYDLTTLAELLALSGEFERAIAIAEEAYDLLSPEDDFVAGTFNAVVLSKVLALSGKRDRALGLLAELIDMPGLHTRWEMYLDPRWDFFRDDERFNDLIRPHNLEDRQGSTE
jgi:tetratricopeptide (TPR) repeat protein